MKKYDVKKIAIPGLLTALCIILGYVESLIPINLLMPGIKIGLTNIVVIYALYALDAKSALLINILRILIVGFLFGNGISIIYSLSGGILAFIIMLAAKRAGLFMPTVSILGGIFHNIGQLLACMVLLKTYTVLYYMIVLFFAGIISGGIVGLLAILILKRIPYYEE